MIERFSKAVLLFSRTKYMAETRVELPENFDFESYINNYKGMNLLVNCPVRLDINMQNVGFTRITRCLFIAKHCDALAVEAYKTAIKEIKETTTNSSKY